MRAEDWTLWRDPDAAQVDAVARGAPRVFVPAARLGPVGAVGVVLADALVRWGVPHAGNRLAVCPHLRASSEAESLFVASLDAPSDYEHLARALRPILDLHEQIEPEVGRLACLLVVVTGCEARRGSRMVEAAHRALKLRAIERGMLTGEFGRALEGRGTTFRELDTRRSPVGEYLALRRLLRSDEKYMTLPIWRRAFDGWFRDHGVDGADGPAPHGAMAVATAGPGPVG